MAHRHKMQKGAAKKAEVAYGNKEVIAEARKTGGGFKSGGKVPGMKGKPKVEKRARGGRTGSPFSSAHRKEMGNCT